MAKALLIDFYIGDFTFWIGLWLRPDLSPNFGLRPKIVQKKYFYFGLTEKCRNGTYRRAVKCRRQ